MNAWLKRCVFNLDLNRESVSEPRTLSGSLFQSLGAKYEKDLPPLVDFAILGTRGVMPIQSEGARAPLRFLSQVNFECSFQKTKYSWFIFFYI